MEKFIPFFENLNEMTNQTGVIIDTFGDPFYNPSLSTESFFGGYDSKERIYFSYDSANKTYVGRIGNPYDGQVVFPLDYKETE